jgi:hypothetical protein
LDVEAIDTVLDNADVKQVVSVLRDGASTDPLLKLFEEIVQQYILLYQATDLGTRLTFLSSFSWITQGAVERLCADGKYAEAAAFWRKSFDGMPVAALTQGDRSGLIAHMRYVIPALLRSGDPKKGKLLLADAQTLCNAILIDRRWDWYAKEGYKNLCFDAADALSVIADSKAIQPVLRIAWSIALKQAGKEALLDRYAQLPLKGKIPDGASAEDAEFFKSFSSGVSNRNGGTKEFLVPIEFNGTKYPFKIFVFRGPNAMQELEDQFQWVIEYRGGSVPQELLDDLRKFFKMAMENKVEFADVCERMFGSLVNDKTDKDSQGKKQ